LHIVNVSPEQSYETLKGYAAILASAGLAVTAREPLIFDSGFQAVTAQLELNDSLTKILEKLSVMTRDMAPARGSTVTKNIVKCSHC
jgi:hypothetical protein